ncbi:MAG: GAF domain-containing protein [Sphaerochaetaceae bacterium]
MRSIEDNESYEILLEQVRGLCSDDKQSFFSLNGALANVSTLLRHSLEDLNWVGFYFRNKSGDLLLGPFSGEVACGCLPAGKGVCQKALSDKDVVNVPDVNDFPSHIACDSKSRSELVVPLFASDEVVAVLDIDSSQYDHFDRNLTSLFRKTGEIISGRFGLIPNYLDIIRINSHYIGSSDERDE